jgi:hypothetical protein
VIGRQQREAFDTRLADEKPIERVAPNQREGRKFERVLPGDGKFRVSAAQEAPAEESDVD